MVMGSLAFRPSALPKLQPIVGRSTRVQSPGVPILYFQWDYPEDFVHLHNERANMVFADGHANSNNQRELYDNYRIKGTMTSSGVAQWL